MMAAGYGLSYVAPEAGVPLALIGGAFEVCAFTGTLLCAAVKAASIGPVATLDKYGNLYIGVEGSWGKSMTPFIGASGDLGIIVNDHNLLSGGFPDIPPATEAETTSFLSGPALSFSCAFCAWQSAAYSPSAEDKWAYQQGIGTTVASINFSYSWLVGKTGITWGSR
jgi:hypothetical protein